MTENIIQESLSSISEYNYRKFKFLTSLGALEILLLLNQNVALDYRQIFERMLDINPYYISLKTLKKALQQLQRYRFVKKRGHNYVITEAGKSIIRWMAESPTHVLNKISVCDKCLSVYEEWKEQCINCKGYLLKGLLFKGLFIESDGSHFFSLSQLKEVPAEDIMIQRSAIRLFVLRYLCWHKEIGVEQVWKTEMLNALEKFYGKYDISFINSILDDMEKLGEIYFPQYNIVATKLGVRELREKYLVKCAKCNTSIELSPLIKDEVQVKPKLNSYNVWYVCSCKLSHILCNACSSKIRASKNGLKICPICETPMKQLDYGKKMELVKKLFPF